MPKYKVFYSQLILQQVQEFWFLPHPFLGERLRGETPAKSGWVPSLLTPSFGDGFGGEIPAKSGWVPSLLTPSFGDGFGGEVPAKSGWVPLFN